MLAKIRIKSELEVLTGMHIGGNNAFAAIGATDSPVIRDVLSNEPMIPGSTLKGKIRSLLARKYNTENVKSCEKDDEKILNLFGLSNNKNNEAKPSRLIFNDIFPMNKQELNDRGVESLTEVKFENNINRLSAVAMPRQIERVIRGTKFDFSVIYDVYDEKNIVEDIKLFLEGIDLLEDDYIGGSGSRGYGRIKFNNLQIEYLTGCDKISEEIKNELNVLLK